MPDKPIPTIDINDLASMLQLIDVVTTRGAFRGEELFTAGTLRNKLFNLVEAHKAANPPPVDAKVE